MLEENEMLKFLREVRLDNHLKNNNQNNFFLDFEETIRYLFKEIKVLKEEIEETGLKIYKEARQEGYDDGYYDCDKHLKKDYVIPTKEWAIFKKWCDIRFEKFIERRKLKGEKI